MHADSRSFSLPRWRATRWLAGCGSDVPDDIRVALISNPYGTLPVFAGGILNTLLVAAVITARSPTPLFIVWLAMEIGICLARLVVLLVARREALAHRPTPTDINLLLSVAWSGSVGYGALVSLASGDWVAATLACVSAGAMVGGICFRNFSAPRLSGTMIVLSLGPTLPGALIAGEPLMFVVFLQSPMYLVAMTMACFRLNKMLIATMRAERENDYRARQRQNRRCRLRAHQRDRRIAGLRAKARTSQLCVISLGSSTATKARVASRSVGTRARATLNRAHRRIAGARRAGPLTSAVFSCFRIAIPISSSQRDVKVRHGS